MQIDTGEKLRLSVAMQPAQALSHTSPVPHSKRHSYQGQEEGGGFGDVWVGGDCQDTDTTTPGCIHSTGPGRLVVGVVVGVGPGGPCDLICENCPTQVCVGQVLDEQHK